MSFSPTPLLKAQFLDDNGNPLSGGLLYTYLAGSSTPVNTYTDSTGGTQNTNPVVLNARGEADVWLSSALAYKFVLKDSLDAEIWSVDNITIPEGGGSGINTDQLVKITNADLAAQFLNDKLTGGDGVNVTIANPGAVEQLVLSVDTTYLDTLYARLASPNTFTAQNDFTGVVKLTTAAGTPTKLLAKEVDGTVVETDLVPNVLDLKYDVTGEDLNIPPSVVVAAGEIAFLKSGASVTQIYISNTDKEGNDLSNVLSKMDKNIIRVQSNDGQYQLFGEIASVQTDVPNAYRFVIQNTAGYINLATFPTSPGSPIGSKTGFQLPYSAMPDLQEAYNNSTDPEITTDNGAVTFKNGGSLDSDNVIEVQNIAGTTTTAVTGDGQVQLDSATVQPQIVFNSNGGVDLNHYIQYNPGNVGGITIKSQQAASEVTTLELNRNSSGEFKLSGNSSDTTKSAQVINTYSTQSDEAYLQLISRNDKTAPKSATLTVSSGSTDSATDSEISLSADKINTHSASVIGRDPVASNEFATKNYTDSSISSAIVGTAVYKGAWNASTNTPDLTSVAKAQGDFYIVSVAGNTLIDGVSEWSVGDWVLFNGTEWEKVDNSQTIPVNVGIGAEVFKSLNGVTNQADFRTLVDGSIISFTQNATDITINDSNVAGVNVANTFTQAQTINGDLSLTSINSRIKGGFGTVSTAGVLDWDDVSNSTSGSGYSLLHSTASNSPLASGINYWYPFTFEHTSKNGTGNRTQLAIPYGNLTSVGNLNYRSYYNTGWTGWREIIATEQDSRDVNFKGVVNLASTTNSSPTPGDNWYDQSNDVIRMKDSQGVFNVRGRYQTATTLTSIDPNINQYEQFNINAQAGALTIAAPTGTPYERQKFIIRIRDNGTARTLTWNSTYTPIGVTLPTQTRGNVNKVLYVGCMYNANLSRWDVIAVAEEA